MLIRFFNNCSELFTEHHAVADLTSNVQMNVKTRVYTGPKIALCMCYSTTNAIGQLMQLVCHIKKCVL